MKCKWTASRISFYLVFVLIGLIPLEAHAQVFVATGRMTRGRIAHSATLLQDGRVLIAGGEPTGSAEIYDPDSGTFTETGAMASVRYNHSAVLLRDGRVLIVGGCRRQPPCRIIAELYNPDTGEFKPTADMSVAQDVSTAVLLRNGKVLVFGDVTAELFDPASETFVPIGNGGLAYNATLLSDGTVLLIGEDTSIFDPATNQFRSLGAHLSRAYFLFGSPAVALLNGTVLFAGSSEVPTGAYTTDANRPSALYDPTIHSFLPAADMTLPHQAGTATLLKDGRVLIAGGYHDQAIPAEFRIPETAEIYDPATGRSSALTASMVRHRDIHTATLLRDGRVLITGGRTAGSREPFVTDTLAELFVPESIQGGVPRLSLDRARYCAGEPWFLRAEPVMPDSAIQISGIWDQTPWTVPDWTTSDQNGTVVAHGNFGRATAGNYLMWIHAGEKVSNTVSISIEDCSRLGQ